LLKVNIAIVLFYGIYRLLFQQDTFFQWKRFALLAIVFISFLYPVIDITRQVVASHQLKNILETIYIPVYNLPEVVVTGNAKGTVNFFPQIVLAIYFLTAGLLLSRMPFQIGTILYKLHHTTKTVLDGQTIYECPGLKTPFSFFRWIVLDSSLYSQTELQEILLHESTHVEQLHSADTMLAELVCAICWFNPFAWLLKREIRMNLEFLADRLVLSSGYGAEHYQFHLLHLSYHKAAATITNNFNVSLLKKRIFMMNKKQTSYRSMWKYTLILPIVVILLFFNYAFQTKAEKSYEMENTQQHLVSVVQDMSQPGNETNDVQQTPAKATIAFTPPKVVKDTIAKESQKPQIFHQVEQMPEFPGGEKALLKWLSENIIYPTIAQEQGIQGKVFLRFVVTPDGSVDEVQVIKDLHPACDEAAVEGMKKMPKWIPGKQNGNPVYVYYNLPISFKLQSSDKATLAFDPPKQSSQTGNNVFSNTQNNRDVIIEIDGKVVSDDELEKFDPKTIESFSVDKVSKPNRLIIKTKK
jgi:TonB family protein